MKTLSLTIPAALCIALASAEERQIGPSDASSSFGFYGTTPENPSGSLICYAVYKKGVDPDGPRPEGELWVATIPLTHRRKVADITAFSPHDGAETCWIDDRRIVFRDWQPTRRTSVLRVVDVTTGRDTLEPLIGVTTLGHAPHNSDILYNVSEKDGVHSGLEPGIHEWNTDTGTTRPVFLLQSEAAAVLAKLPASAVVKEGLLPPAKWQTHHAQYSPDGRRVLFRLDVAKAEDAWLTAICDIDGKNLVVMKSEPHHLLHALWHDSESIVAHDRAGAPWTTAGVLKRWKIGAEEGEPIGIPGNHLAVSPDGRYFASETSYHSDPVILRYFAKDTRVVEEAKIVTEHRAGELVWKRRFHINPSFSRDGKRLYYHKPLSDEINGTFYRDVDGL